MQINDTNLYSNQTVCIYQDQKQEKAINIINTINAVLLPFIVMVIFSTLLVHTIVKSRLRSSGFKSSNGRNRLRRDFRFALSSFTLNIFFVFFNFPIVVGDIFKFINISTIADDITYIIFYLNYSLNFYILFLINSIFKREVLDIKNSLFG